MLAPKFAKSVNVNTHLSALQSIFDFIETGIPAEIHSDTHGRGFDVMRLYNAIEIEGKVYRVKSTVKKVRQGNNYYTYEIQEMELLEDTQYALGLLNVNNERQLNSNNSITGAKLLNGVKKTNSNEDILQYSKIIDSNGEPRVMYHGSNYRPLLTEGTFKAFDGAFGKGIYFTSAFPEAADYAREKLDDYDLEEDEIYEDGYVTEAFLNVRNSDNIEWSNYGYGEIIAWAENSNQIKSATDNIGTFDSNNPDIRFRSVEDLETIYSAVDRFKEQFKAVAPIVVIENTEQLRKLYANASQKEFDEIAKTFKEASGMYDSGINKIIIFAENSNNAYTELLHENTHAAIYKLYRSNNLDSKFEHFIKDMQRMYPDGNDLVAEYYSGDEMIDELVAYTLSTFLQSKGIDVLLSKLSSQAQQEISTILNTIGYEKGRKQHTPGYAAIFATRENSSRNSRGQGDRSVYGTIHQESSTPTLSESQMGISKNERSPQGKEPITSFRSINPGESLTDYARAVVANSPETRFRTSSEIEAEYPNWLDGTTTDSGKHFTQVEGTRKTYKKVGDWIEQNLGKDIAILDASSGMGYGTADLRERGFNIDDVEPYQSEERRQNNPATFDSYDSIDKQYDFIISNAVLNVIPDDWRAGLLHDMAEHLAPGGRMFINTRKAGEEKSIKDKIELDSPQEILVKRNGRIASYQRFFTPSELKEWVQQELGEGYTVEIANKANSGTSGLAAVVVTKNNESPTGKGKAYELGQPISNHKGMENAPLANITAKVDKNTQRANRLDKIISSIEKKGGMGPHEFLHEVINAMMLSENTSTRHSRYAKLGGGVTLRLADHYGVASNFKIHNSLKNNYGLVIKLSNHRYKSDKEVDYLEYVYFPDKLNEERQLEILKGLKGFIETGRFDLLPTPDRVHPSGKFNTPETRFRALGTTRINKYKVEKIFGGIWIRTKKEFAKFASAVENYAFEEDGEGIAYTDNFLYAYYWNIDGQPIPYASVYLNREQSQDIVNQVNQKIKDGRKDKRAKEYIDSAIEWAWISKTTNNVNNGNNNSLSNRARNGRLGSNLLRKGRYYDNPSLYVKTQRPDNSQQLTSTPTEDRPTRFRSIAADTRTADNALDTIEQAMATPDASLCDKVKSKTPAQNTASSVITTPTVELSMPTTYYSYPML